jgi:hypothetical protein
MTCRASQGDGMFCAPRFDYTDKRAEPWFYRGSRLGACKGVTNGGFWLIFRLRDIAEVVREPRPTNHQSLITNHYFFSVGFNLIIIYFVLPQFGTGSV